MARHAAGREQHHVGGDPLAGLEDEHGPARRAVGDGQGLHRLAEAEGDVPAAHLVEQLVDDLAVEELERPLPPLDERDGHAERREDRGVLDADHTGAHHRERAGEMLQVHDVVGGQEHLAVGGDAGQGRGLGADGDHDVGGGDVTELMLAADDQPVRIGEGRLPVQHRDVIPTELALDHLDLARDDAVEAGEEVRAGRPPLEARPRQAVAPSGDARVGDDRLAERLARDGAGHDADAAERPPLLHDRRAHPELRRLHGGALAGRAAADAHEIEVVGR